MTIVIFAIGFLCGTFLKFSPYKDAVSDVADDFERYFRAHGSLPKSLDQLGPEAVRKAQKYQIAYNRNEQRLQSTGGWSYSNTLSRLFTGARASTVGDYGFDLKEITGQTESGPRD